MQAAAQAAEPDVSLELAVVTVAVQIINAAAGQVLGAFADKLVEAEDRLFVTVQHTE